mgnify:FL=1
MSLRGKAIVLFVSFAMLLVIFVLASILIPYDSRHFGLPEEILLPPSLEHPFGTDEVGRDLFAQCIYGSRASLLVGVLAGLLSALIGTGVGLLAGYYGGRAGEFLMRVTDAFLVIPSLPLVLILLFLLGPRLDHTILILGLLGWPGISRVVRSQVLSFRERLFVERVKSLGASDLHVISHHILPAVMPIATANTILVSAVAILSESTISFLGLGDPLHLSWGTILHFSFSTGALNIGAYWYSLPPGMLIMLTTLYFTFVGNRLNAVFNPRSRERWI